MLKTPLCSRSVDYDPQTTEVQVSGYAKLASAVLENAVTEWKAIQENELPYDAIHLFNCDVGEERKELIDCFNSDWFVLLWTFIMPDVAYEQVLNKLKIPKRRDFSNV